MTPSPDNGASDGHGVPNSTPWPAPDVAYAAAFGRAVRDAMDAARPELPPPALLAAILAGGASGVTSKRAPDRPRSNTEAAFRSGGDSAAARTPFVILDRPGRALGAAPPSADRGQRRPAWTRWTPVAAAAGLALAVGAAGLATLPGDERGPPNSGPDPRVAARPRSDDGGGDPTDSRGSFAPSVRSPGVRSPSAVAGDGLLRAPVGRNADTSSITLGQVVTFLRRGNTATGYVGALPWDSIVVALGAVRKGVMDFDDHRTEETVPVVDGVEVSVRRSVARDAVTDTLVRAIAAAARDVRAECRRRGGRGKGVDPAKTEWWLIHVDPALLADGSALARARRAARVSGGADAPTVWILNALTFVPSRGERPGRRRAFLARRDLPRAVIKVSYPEVCG